jgi:aspartyl-tRNA synthetase
MALRWGLSRPRACPRLPVAGGAARALPTAARAAPLALARAPLTAAPARPTSSSSDVPYAVRSLPCGAVGPSLVGQRVTLAGWVAASRVLGDGLVFLSLRDGAGEVQIIVEAGALASAPGSDAAASSAEGRADAGCDLLSAAAALRLESVVRVTGTVRLRAVPGGATASVRDAAPAGPVALEVAAHSLTLLSPASAPLPL